MSTASTYKPSPLSFGSPRTSPFRRPESPIPHLSRPQSPSSPSQGLRPSTPNLSPAKNAPNQSPSPTKLLNNGVTPSDPRVWTSQGIEPVSAVRNGAASPTRISSAIRPPIASLRAAPGRLTSDEDALSKLPVAQVRELREAFQILDEDNDGLVKREDISHTLNNLGQPCQQADITPFFPPGAPQTLPLSSYLSSLASLLAPLSGPKELLNAFAAFDDHDSGEVDVAELRESLLNTAPDPGERALSEREVQEAMKGFTGRRAFGRGQLKNMAGGRMNLEAAPVDKGDVFKYQEWVGGITGSGDTKVAGEI